MPKLLVIESSPRGQYSISRNLTATFVTQWKAAHLEGEVVQRDLIQTKLPFTDLPWLGASLTPIEQHSPEMKEVLQLSDELVAELLAADHIVIGTPVYNYNVPAVLKAYIDHIVRKGLTLGLKQARFWPGILGQRLLVEVRTTIGGAFWPPVKPT